MPAGRSESFEFCDPNLNSDFVLQYVKIANQETEDHLYFKNDLMLELDNLYGDVLWIYAG